MVVDGTSDLAIEPMVHSFGDGRASSVDRNLLGGKGSGLAEMSRLGIPVPPGLTITTDVCVTLTFLTRDVFLMSWQTKSC